MAGHRHFWMRCPAPPPRDWRVECIQGSFTLTQDLSEIKLHDATASALETLMFSSLAPSPGDVIHVYSDGSHTPGDPALAGWAFVVIISRASSGADGAHGAFFHRWEGSALDGSVESVDAAACEQADLFWALRWFWSIKAS